MTIDHSTPTNRQTIALVFGVTAFALLLRLLFIDHAAPFNYHPDEHMAYDVAVRMLSSGHYNPHWFHWPSLIFYVEWVIVAVIHGVADTPLEVLSSESISPGMYPEGQWAYLLWGRVFVAITGALTCAFAAATAIWIGRFAKVSPQWTLGLGGFAGLATAVAPLHLTHSHYLTTDVPATFGIAGTLYYSVRILDNPKWRWVLLGGLFAGVGAGFKYTGAVACIPLGLATLLSCSSWSIGLRRFGVAALASAAVFVATTPYAVLDFATFREGLLFDLGHYSSGHVGHTVENALVSMLKTLARTSGSGLALSLLSLGAMAVLFETTVRGRLWRVLLCVTGFAVVYALLFVNAATHFDRSALPLIPVMVASAVLCLAACVQLPGERTSKLVAIASTAVLAATTLGTLPALAALASERTETQAYHWFEEYVPENARIFREYYTPQLNPEKYRVVARFTASDMAVESLGEFGDDFIVVSSWVFRRFTEPDGPVAEHRFAFYQALFQRRFTAVFCPQPGVTGPEVWVFALSQRAQALNLEMTLSGECRTSWPWLPQASAE